MAITKANLLGMIRNTAGIKQPAKKINRCPTPVSIVLRQKRHQQDDMRPHQWRKPDKPRR